MQTTLSFFLQMFLKSTALLLLAFVFVRFFRGRSAALRHQIWSLALASLLLLPVFSVLLPVWRVPLSPNLWSEPFLIRTEAHAPLTTQAHPSSPLAVLAAAPGWNASLAAVWSVGAAACLLQMLFGWIAVSRLSGRSASLTLPEFESLARSLGIQRKIDLRQSPTESMPITYGVKQPTILLPAATVAWSPDRRRAVLLHELAHVKRCDAFTQILCRFALALFWWQPLAWFAWREFLKEREQAADDLVLNLLPSATDYAGHLLAIARSLRLPRFQQGTAIAMARSNQLESRLAAILDVNRVRTTPTLSNTIATAAMALAIAAPWAALHAGVPQTSTQQASEPNAAAAALISQGKAALKQKDYTAATTLFQNALSADSANPTTANLWLAITEHNHGSLTMAVEFYQKALATQDQTTPGAATVMEMESSALTQLQRADEARKLTEQAQAIRSAQVNQETAAHPPSPDAYKVGDGVKPPTLLTKIEPSYSEDAALARYSGSVVLRIEIGVDGFAHNFVVLRPLGFGLDRQAIEAVKKWKFQPGTKDGKAVTVTANVEVSFRLL